MAEATNYVRSIEHVQGIRISVPEEIALYNNWITVEQLLRHADDYGKSPYGDYLRQIARGRVQEPIHKQEKNQK